MSETGGNLEWPFSFSVYFKITYVISMLLTWSKLTCIGPSSLQLCNNRGTVANYQDVLDGNPCKNLNPRPYYNRKNLKTAFSLWKRIKCFSSDTTPEEFKITGHFGSVFKENHVIIMAIVFKKFCLQMFFVYAETKSQRFQIPPVRRVFSKSSVFVAD